jgi:hypothetical protein
MLELWVTHLTERQALHTSDRITPLNRVDAKRRTWDAADRQMKRPFEMAAEFNSDATWPHPYSPG